MNIEQMLAVLDPEIVGRLKTAIEIGSGLDGVALTQEQRSRILYAGSICVGNKKPPETERSGYIDRGTKEEGETCDDDNHKHDEFKPIRFV